jgi:membrane protease YdiL (CAAX protease family)
MTAPKRPDVAHGPLVVLWSGTCLYVVMVAAALGWLWWRDRLDLLPARSIGAHGLLLGSLVGLVVGVSGSWAVAWLSPRWTALRQHEDLVRQTFAGISPLALTGFVVIAATAEELFFRLAVQDAFGLLGAVAVCAGLNSCPGGWRLLPFVVLHATVLGVLVDRGFGLLGATTANAILNHLNLRRIQSC